MRATTQEERERENKRQGDGEASCGERERTSKPRWHRAPVFKRGKRRKRAIKAKTNREEKPAACRKDFMTAIIVVACSRSHGPTNSAATGQRSALRCVVSSTVTHPGLPVTRSACLKTTRSCLSHQTGDVPHGKRMPPDQACRHRRSCVFEGSAAAQAHAQGGSPRLDGPPVLRVRPTLEVHADRRTALAELDHRGLVPLAVVRLAGQNSRAKARPRGARGTAKINAALKPRKKRAASKETSTLCFAAVQSGGAMHSPWAGRRSGSHRRSGSGRSALLCPSHRPCRPLHRWALHLTPNAAAVAGYFSARPWVARETSKSVVHLPRKP